MIHRTVATPEVEWGLRTAWRSCPLADNSFAAANSAAPMTGKWIIAGLGVCAFVIALFRMWMTGHVPLKADAFLFV